jgi:23S rRNA pseudouridine2457 synthase
LFFKPYGVLSQFTREADSRWRCLADFIAVPGVYAAGRLDADSEGLLLLTANGRLQQRLTDPAHAHWRRYWVQVEGEAAAQPEAIQRLARGVAVQGRLSLPARARPLDLAEVTAAQLPERDPPIRQRQTVPTSWLELELREGRNRQVRRMTAAVGLPTLRLIRMGIDLMDGEAPLTLMGLEPGAWRQVSTAEHQRLQRLLGASRSAAIRSVAIRSVAIRSTANPSAAKGSESNRSVANGSAANRSTANGSAANPSATKRQASNSPASGQRRGRSAARDSTGR